MFMAVCLCYGEPVCVCLWQRELHVLFRDSQTKLSLVRPGVELDSVTHTAEH